MKKTFKEFKRLIVTLALLFSFVGTVAYAAVLSVPQGGTFNNSFTPYAVITGGVTPTGQLQQVSGTGTSGYVLTSNGASAFPTWQASSGGGMAIGGSVTGGNDNDILFVNAGLLDQDDNFTYDKSTRGFIAGSSGNFAGNLAQAFGNFTEASGDTSFAGGVGTIASEDHAFAFGNTTQALGRGSVALGDNTESDGNDSFAMGNSTRAYSYAENVLGSYNTSYTPTSTTGFSATDRLFVLGNGTISTPSNALTVLKNGFVGIGTDTPSQGYLEIAKSFPSSNYTALALRNTGSGTGSAVQQAFYVAGNGLATGAIAHTYNGTGYLTTFQNFTGSSLATAITIDGTSSNLVTVAGSLAVNTSLTVTGNIVGQSALYLPTTTLTTNGIDSYYVGGSASGGIRTFVAAGGLASLSIDSTGITTIPNLAGTGSRAVVASSTGVLSTAAYQAPITLTTTGTSGAATLISNVLNVPQYAAGTTPSIGGTITSATIGSVLYAGSAVFAQDNSNFFYDATNHRLGLGTTSPSRSLMVQSTAGNIALFKSTDASNPARVTIDATTGSGNTGFDMSIAGTQVWAAAAYKPSGTNYSFTFYNTVLNRSGLFIEGDTNNVALNPSGAGAVPNAFTVGGTYQFQVTSAGAIAAATGITSSGGITFSGLAGTGTNTVVASSTGVLSTVPQGTLPYVAKTGAYTATTVDYEIDCTSGTFTVTLPNSAAGNAGKLYVVTNSGAGVITVTTAGGTQTVGNAALTSTTLAAGASTTFHSTGAAYRIN